MGLALIIAVVSLPILELFVLIKLGGAIGVLPLLLLLVAMALVGGWLLRRQGLSAVARAMRQMADNEPPVQAVVDGIGLTLAGVLMVLPGLITDVLALLLLIPAVRRLVVGRLFGIATVISVKRPGGPFGGRPAEAPERPYSSPSQPRDGVVIEGEFERIEERTVRPGRAPQDGPDGEPGDGSGAPRDPNRPSPWRK